MAHFLKKRTLIVLFFVQPMRSHKSSIAKIYAGNFVYRIIPGSFLNFSFKVPSAF